MKKAIYILLILFFAFNIAKSQGFDWQYSPRLPFNYPYLFVGLNGSVNYTLHNSALDLSEGGGDCCQYTNGSGIGNSIGIRGEFWMNGHRSVNVQISYLTNRGSFDAPGYSVPFTVFDKSGKIIGHDTADFENSMISKLNYVTLELGGKQQLFSSHLFAGLSLEFGYLLAQSNELTETVISPSYFKYNDGSRQRVIADYKLSNISKFLFIPKILVGYDIPIHLGYYTTPYISAGMPVQNISTEGSWRYWSFTFGISISRAVAYK